MKLRILAFVFIAALLFSGSATAAPAGDLADTLLDNMVTATEIGLGVAGHEGSIDWLRPYIIEKTVKRYPQHRAEIERVVSDWYPLLVAQVQKDIPPFSTVVEQGILTPSPVYLSDDTKATWRNIVVASLKKPKADERPKPQESVQ